MLPQVKLRDDGTLVVTADRPQDGVAQILFLTRNDAADVRDRLNYLLGPKGSGATPRGVGTVKPDVAA
jgi:hypothetical protein